MCARDDTSPASRPGLVAGAGRGLREDAVWSDLAALTPPLVVCVAVLIGVAMLLRSQMSPKRRAERDERRRSPDQRSRNIRNGGFYPAAEVRELGERPGA